jgi:pyridoxine 4-dehydrogenase
MSVSESGTFQLGDIPINRLGFGAMRITGPGVWGHPADVPGALGLLRTAVDLGVNFIDTADSYGPEVSEYLIAEALHPYTDGLIIATKGGLVRGGPGDWRRNGQPKHLEVALENSLRRLRVDCIELYQLHAPDPQVPIEESLGVLARAQEAGKIRHIGLSNVSVELIERARKVVKVVTVQNRYNLLYRETEDDMRYCEANGIGFIPWYPLATGKLAEGDGTVATVAERLGSTSSQVALAWLLQRSPVMLPIPGTSSVAHLEQNCAGGALQLSAADVELLDG